MNTAARTISCLALLSGAFITTAGASEAQISNAESGWAAIKTCAAIQEDESRHACFDNVSRAAGLMPPVEASHRKGFGLQRSTEPAVTAAGAPEPGTQQHEKDQLEVTLAAVEKRGDGKLVFTTADGAIWQQVESEPIRPIPEQGQTMTITKASLGSYLCKPGKWVAFRCARAR